MGSVTLLSVGPLLVELYSQRPRPLLNSSIDAALAAEHINGGREQGVKLPNAESAAVTSFSPKRFYRRRSRLLFLPRLAAERACDRRDEADGTGVSWRHSQADWMSTRHVEKREPFLSKQICDSILTSSVRWEDKTAVPCSLSLSQVSTPLRH